MKKLFLFMVLIPFFAFAQTEDTKTYTKAGQDVPKFKVTTIDGTQIDIAQLKGKVVLINLFATWCGPCMAEMPRVEKEVWQQYKDKGLVVLAFGREHSKEELLKFQKEKGFTFLIAPDQKREVFSLFAKESIPRNYVIDKDGKIAMQGIGYTAAEFEEMKHKIEELLKK